MYGFFNHAFEKFITLQYGEDKWEIIRLEAGVFEESFDEKIVYDDNMIHELIDAAADVLDIEPEVLQADFGTCYFEHCLGTSHGDLLGKLGRNLYDFLSNVDSLHDYLSLQYAGLKIPTFRVKEDSFRRCITLQYYSDREDLEFITKGIIEQAAKKLFDLSVTVQIFFDANQDTNTFLITANDPDDSDRMFPKVMELSRDLIPHANEPKVSPLEFCKIFPFHMIFNRDMELLQIGTTLRRILKDINNFKTPPVAKFFTLSRPQIDFTFEAIYSRLNNTFVMTSLDDVVKPSLVLQQAHQTGSLPRRSNIRLKGEMIYIDDRDAMLFMCSPSVSNIADMRNKGLCLSDIPIHDATRDLVLLSENIQKELELTQQLRVVSDHLTKIHSELESEMHLYNRLLESVLPNSIAASLCEMKAVPAERFDCVTLMFSGINKFADLCQGMESHEIVSMLNDLYTKFDVFVTFLEGFAYKVETVGDTYMTASGLPERVSNHAYVMCTLALDMQDAAKEVTIKGKKIMLTFGIHSGEVVAGVIGQKMPRYCVFGNAVNLTSRTQSTGIPGRINVTEYTYRLLEESNSFEHFHFEKRGQVKMKGKAEPMTTYILRRAEKSRDPAYSFTADSMMSTYGSIPNTDGLLTNSAVGGGFTLNRSRAGSGGGMRRSRNTSQHASRFTTPGQSTHHSRYATPRAGRSRCNSTLSTSPLRAGSYLHTEDEESSIKSPHSVRKAPLRRMRSNLAFEVLNEVETVSSNSSSETHDTTPGSSSSIFGTGILESLQDISGQTPKASCDETTTALAVLEIDDLPLSVSPSMNRRWDVTGILKAVNNSLTHD